MVVPTTRRGIKAGIGYGIVAGIIFAIVEMLAAGVTGQLGLMPLRMSASVVMGEAAMTTTAVGSTVFVGIVVHLVLSALFGLLYGLIEDRMSPASRTSLGIQALYGIGFGVALWFVNFQIIARLLYPWFLMTPQGLQMLMHALAFGLPLGLMFAATERRVPIRTARRPV